MDRAWAGIDAGKEMHWVHVLDVSVRSFFRKVKNDEADLSALIDEVLSLAEEVVWAIDQPGGGATLLLGLLWQREQRVLYVPGLTVDRSRDTYPGESKTDARDAHVIADQSRMRPGLQELTAGQEELAELEILLSRRRDLVTDKSRSVTRLRETLLSAFPALERALDLNRRGALTFISHYQRPAQIRRAGRKRLAAYLRNRGVQGAVIADKALEAARAQSVTLPAEEIAARIVAELAEEILSLKDRIESIDEELEKRFFALPEARVLARPTGDGTDPRGGVPGRRRRPFRLRQRRPARRLRRTGSGRPRLRQEGGQPSQDARRQQGPKAGLLPVGLCQPAAPRSPEPSTIARGEKAKSTSSLDRPRPEEGQCSVGDAA